MEEVTALPVDSTNNATIVADILSSESSGKLLDKLVGLIESDQLWILGDGNLAWSTMPISGWRWEASPSDDGRIILAIKGTSLIAIYESKHTGIRLSLLNASRENTVDLDASAAQHVTAMSAKHLSHKSPELFKVYYDVAGPTRQIVSSRSLPKPAWAMKP